VVVQRFLLRAIGTVRHPGVWHGVRDATVDQSDVAEDADLDFAWSLIPGGVGLCDVLEVLLFAGDTQGLRGEIVSEELAEALGVARPVLVVVVNVELLEDRQILSALGGLLTFLTPPVCGSAVAVGVHSDRRDHASGKCRSAAPSYRHCRGSRSFLDALSSQPIVADPGRPASAPAGAWPASHASGVVIETFIHWQQSGNASVPDFSSALVARMPGRRVAAPRHFASDGATDSGDVVPVGSSLSGSGSSPGVRRTVRVLAGVSPDQQSAARALSRLPARSHTSAPPHPIGRNTWPRKRRSECSPLGEPSTCCI
jgi:hypothetical protein